MGLNALRSKDDRSQSVQATANGDAFLLDPRKIATEAQDLDSAVHGDPSRGAEPFWHFQILNNEFLPILKLSTGFARVRRHRALVEDFRGMETPQNGNLDVE